MRVRYPAKAVALFLILSLCSILVLMACSPRRSQGPPDGRPSPVNPSPTGIPTHEARAFLSGPRPEAMIMVSSGVMTVDEPLTIAGSGFLPGEPVTLVLVVDDIVSFVIGGRTAEQPVANAAGAFAVSFESISGEGRGARGALERAPGIRTIRAEGEDGSRASAPVMITPSVNAPVASSLVASSEGVINAETNGIDVTITARGIGFMPGEAVTVTIVSLADGADKILVGGTANDSGVFALSATLSGTVPVEGAAPEMPIAPGVYTLLAEGAGGSVAIAVLVVEKKELPEAAQ